MEYKHIEALRDDGYGINKIQRESCLETHYKRVERNLKRRKKENLFHFEHTDPINIEEIVFRLVFKGERTLINGKTHCSELKYRSAQDLFHLFRFYGNKLGYKKFYHNKKYSKIFTYKGCSELLQYLCDEKLLIFQYCNTVNREVYIPMTLKTTFGEVKKYVEKYLNQ